jgi:hypothetical protein
MHCKSPNFAPFSSQWPKISTTPAHNLLATSTNLSQPCHVTWRPLHRKNDPSPPSSAGPLPPCRLRSYLLTSQHATSS